MSAKAGPSSIPIVDLTLSPDLEATTSRLSTLPSSSSYLLTEAATSDNNQGTTLSRANARTALIGASDNIASAINTDAANASGSTSLSTQQLKIVIRRPNSQDLRKPQSGLSIDEVRVQGESRLRALHCHWSGCDALLGSLTLLRKHLERHYAQLDRARPSSSMATCRWDACGHRAAVFEIDRHIEDQHLIPLRNGYCPFKDCPWPYLKPMQVTSHYSAPFHQKRPWTVNDFRPSATDLKTNPKSKKLEPIIRNLHWNPFWETVLPFRRVPLEANGIVLRRSSSRSSGPLSLDVVRNIIKPQVTPDDYFLPVNGNTPSGHRERELTSWTFFRHPLYHDPDIEHNRETRHLIRDLRLQFAGNESDDITEQMMEEGGSPFDGLMPHRPYPGSTTTVHVQPRVDRSKIAPMMDADMFASLHFRPKKRKRDRMVIELDVKDKGKEIPVEGLSVENLSIKPEDKISSPKIVRASRSLAKRHSGLQLGIGHWRERLWFEKRGIELGELPDTHHI